MCCFQLSLLSRIMPRNLVCSTICICSPSILILISGESCFLEGPKIIIFVFFRFNESLFVRSHSTKSGISELIDCSREGNVLPEVIRFESSANSRTLEFLKMEPRLFV